MTLQAILLPVFVQVGLVFWLLGLMGARRLAAVRAGAVRREDVVMGQKNWPASAQQAANAFSNQFELPLLFFALVPLAILTRKADLAFVILSWVFVVARFVQAAVYVTTNHLPVRFGAYATGAAALLALWVVFAIRILLGPLPA